MNPGFFERPILNSPYEYPSRHWERARIVVANYHAFLRRETLPLSKGGRALLQGPGPEPLGVRAFGTQLLCEQVVGRALRRQSYDADADGLFDVEYADVLGIPFDFTAKPVPVRPQKPRETVLVRAIAPERDACEIRFPRVAGYRVELSEERLTARFDDDATRIAFAAVTPWPGECICAEGRYLDGAGDSDSGPDKRAGIFVGPEFGTVSRPDLVAAAREAGDAGFDVLISCAFNYEAQASEFNRLGRTPVLKARMNADLHMAGELKNTGKGNLFVVFGEPDIDVLPAGGEDAGGRRIQVKINGVDVYHPATGEVRSDGAGGIACWFIDTDYDEESFFVRHAYFLGANDPYKALRTTLKAEIDADAWASLHRDVSRPFDRPESGRIAVKVINHLGDEVMKVFRV